MDAGNLFEYALGAIVALGGFIMKQLHTRIDETEKGLMAHKQHVAENYANNNTVERLTESINKRFDRFEDKLDKLFTKDE